MKTLSLFCLLFISFTCTAQVDTNSNSQKVQPIMLVTPPDTLNMLSLAEHLDRAGANFIAGDLFLLAGLLVGTSATFANTPHSAKSRASTAAVFGCIGIGLRITGGAHLVIAGKKIRFRK